jgi:hypothetical protein
MWTHFPTSEEKERYPGLQALVQSHMVHGHCAQCQTKDGQCRWGFPLPAVPHTVQLPNGKWVTRRGPADSCISAYHPAVLLRTRCHANCNCTNGTASIGYLFKYPFKGDASIRACLADLDDSEGPRDEILRFQTMRVVSASEAIFRLLEYPIAMVTPAVRSIKVLLPSNKYVYRRAGVTAEEARERFHSDVDRWFARPPACEQVPFRTYFEAYIVAPKPPSRCPHHLDNYGAFVSLRQRKATLVHVGTAPFNAPQWHTRLLLLQQDCLARSWREVRTVDNVVCESFSEATNALGLLDTHQAAVATIADELTSILHTPVRARVLFFMVLKHFKCDPVDLLDTFLEDLTEADWIGPQARTTVIADLHRRLLAQQSSVAQYGFDVPVLECAHAADDISDAADVPDCSTLQPDQRAIFECVSAHLSQGTPQAPLFVHVEGEPGGGKSFLLHALLVHARTLGRLCLPAAFPAKVARKFPGGQTAHFWLALSPSTLGETITLHAEAPSTSPHSDTKQQAVGRRLKDARLIFVDEVTMMRGDELDAVVAKLEELCFRGAFMIVGNCAQLGTVMPGADDATLIASAIVNAQTFGRFEHYRLTGQMCMSDSELRDAVHSVGYGT